MQDFAYYIIVLFKEMHVSGRNNRLAELIAELYHLAVKVLDNLKIGNFSETVGYSLAGFLVLFIGICGFTHHKGVVSKRLYFEIIVIFRYSHKLLVRLPVDNSLVKLALLAGTAENKTFS